MAVRVGINGFGRIGRNIMRAALGDKNIDFVAVNDLTNAATLAHLAPGFDAIEGHAGQERAEQPDASAVGLAQHASAGGGGLVDQAQ